MYPKHVCFGSTNGTCFCTEKIRKENPPNRSWILDSKMGILGIWNIYIYLPMHVQYITQKSDVRSKTVRKYSVKPWCPGKWVFNRNSISNSTNKNQIMNMGSFPCTPSVPAPFAHICTVACTPLHIPAHPSLPIDYTPYIIWATSHTLPSGVISLRWDATDVRESFIHHQSFKDAINLGATHDWPIRTSSASQEM